MSIAGCYNGLPAHASSTIQPNADTHHGSIASTSSVTRPLVAIASPAWIVGIPFPIDEVSAGLLDDRLQRGGVPDVHDRVDHHFGPAGGDHQIAVAIAPSAGQAGRPLQFHEHVQRVDRAMRREAGDFGRQQAGFRSVDATVETRAGCGSAFAPARYQQPPPLAAYTVSASAGAWITPTSGSPSRSTATSVVYSGTPWMNDFVPSIGSRIH